LTVTEADSRSFTYLSN